MRGSNADWTSARDDDLRAMAGLGNFEALVTLDFTATDLSDAVQPFKSLLKADIVRQPRSQDTFDKCKWRAIQPTDEDLMRGSVCGAVYA